MAISSAIVPYKGNTSSAIVKPKQKLSGGHAVSDKSADAGRSMRRSALLLMRRRIQRDRLEKKYFGLLDKQKQKAKARAEEEKQEQTSFLSGVGSGVKKSAEKLGGNLFGALGDLLGFLALNWMADPANQKVLEGIVKGVGAVIKFIDWWVTGSVINLFDGFHKLITGDSILERVLGFFQMVTGAVGIFYALNPHKAIIHSFKLIKGAPKITQFFRIFFKKWAKKGIGNALKFMFPKTAAVLKAISGKLSSVFGIPAAKTWTANVIKKIQSKLTSVFKIPQAKELVAKVMKKISLNVGNVLKGNNLIGHIAKKLIKLAKGGGKKGLGKALKTLATPFKKVAGKIPLIGPLLSIGLNVAFGDPWDKAIVKAFGAGLGQWLGAGIGTLIFPGVGTFLGGFLGGLIGDWLGGRIFDLFAGRKPSKLSAEEKKKAKVMSDERKRLEALQKEKGWSDEELAAQIDLSVGSKMNQWRLQDKKHLKENSVLSTSISTNDTQIYTHGKGGIKVGGFIRIGNEVLKIISLVSSGETKVGDKKFKSQRWGVKRGYGGTPITAHDSGQGVTVGATEDGSGLVATVRDDIAARLANMENGSKNKALTNKLNSINTNKDVVLINNGGDTYANYTTVNGVNANTNNNTDQKNL